jgi:flagellar biosynthesis protein FlhG
MSAKNIIAVASGKGGVGKTWVSSTISHVFANSGRKALLFDGDIGLANVDVQLGVSPQTDLSDVFTGKATLREAITKYVPGKFDIIAGRSGSGSLGNLSSEKINSLRNDLNDLAKSYDLVILDLGAGVEAQVQAMASLASKCLVVITDEPTSLTDAYAFIKILRLQNRETEVQIIVNQAENQREGMRTYNNILNACENFLKFSPRLAGIIRKDPKVKDSIRSQKPTLLKNPRSIAAADVAAMSVKLMAK